MRPPKAGVTSLVFIVAITLVAQKQTNVWYFGDHAGVDFGTGAPEPAEGSAVHFTDNYAEGTAALSDSSGALLFYTDGETLWNREHQPMPNGQGLMGNFSATQSALVIPKPGGSRLYYVFTVDDYYDNHLANGFRYTVVDMCAEDGLGDVADMAEKNILLLDTVEEKVAAVRHSNGLDYWVLTHKLYSDAYHAFRLTDNGILDHVISHVGAVHDGFQGQLKFSPLGDHVACASALNWVAPYLFEYLDFDPSTGTVSNARALTRPNDGGIYGTEFSPDGTKLYGVFGGLTPLGMGVVQYDVTAGGGTENAINASMTAIYCCPVKSRTKSTGSEGRLFSRKAVPSGRLAGWAFSQRA